MLILAPHSEQNSNHFGVWFEPLWVSPLGKGWFLGRLTAWLAAVPGGEDLCTVPAARGLSRKGGTYAHVLGKLLSLYYLLEFTVLPSDTLEKNPVISTDIRKDHKQLKTGERIFGRS